MIGAYYLNRVFTVRYELNLLVLALTLPASEMI